MSHKQGLILDHFHNSLRMSNHSPSGPLPGYHQSTSFIDLSVWTVHMGVSLMAQQVKICLQCRRHRKHGFNDWVGKIPWRRKWQPTPVFLPEKSHGQRSLVGYNLSGCKELAAAERLSRHAHTAHSILPWWLRW